MPTVNPKDDPEFSHTAQTTRFQRNTWLRSAHKKKIHPACAEWIFLAITRGRGGTLIAALPHFRRSRNQPVLPGRFAVGHQAGIWITNDAHMMKFRRIAGYRRNPTALLHSVA
jgi:hypothetical protein